MRPRLSGLYAGLTVANIAAWGWAWAAFRDHPALLGMALLAYGFGLRHAVDADHIAAIDNVARKLMQEGKRPIAIGCFFALGHASIVLVAATAIAASATTLQRCCPGLVDAGSAVGTMVSAAFLWTIAVLNAALLVGVFRLLRATRRGVPRSDEIAALLARSGLLARVLRRLFGLISHSWQMYPLGLLFGLSFDTASEIGLLAIAAGEAANGLPISSILVFPVLFAAGMSLVDTTDGVLMLGVYGWAFANPVRKLHYNLMITLLSVVVAVLVGGIEVLGLVAGKFGLAGGPWDIVNLANRNLGTLGYIVIAVFVACWALSLLVCRLIGYDKTGSA